MVENIILIIQARMNSTRLPGKVLLKVFDKSLLEYLIERVRSVELIDEIFVATSENSLDDAICSFCKTNGVNFFRGSENDVLSRFYHLAKKQNASIVIRVCADSPIIDPKIISEFTYAYLSAKPRVDYLSNTLNQTYPIGMNVEVFSFEALEIAYENSSDTYQKEHVTPYIYENPDMFVICEKHFYAPSHQLRLTIDYAEDFVVLSRVIKSLYPQNSLFDLEDIITLSKSHPTYFDDNAHRTQTARRILKY